jgi:nucleoside-diphosphate-sugar epimerase
MKLFFTGATGAIGREAVPRLVGAGHEVTAAVRSSSDQAWLSDLGVQSVVVDLFDRDAVSDAVAGADAVLHFATAIPPASRITKRDSWNTNDRLRAEATSYLADAALDNGVAVFIQESITFIYADGGEAWLDESAPIDLAWDVLDSALVAEREVQRFTLGGGRGIALRLSSLYGPGRASGGYLEGVAARKVPLVGSGDQYISRLHTHDAGTAVAAAVTAPAGVYNVSDDEPLHAGEDLTITADLIGAKMPRRVPPWLAKLVAGPASNLLAISQRVSNRQFKATTGWQPHYGSARDGWPAVMGIFEGQS